MLDLYIGLIGEIKVGLSILTKGTRSYIAHSKHTFGWKGSYSICDIVSGASWGGAEPKDHGPCPPVVPRVLGPGVLLGVRAMGCMSSQNPGTGMLASSSPGLVAHVQSRSEPGDSKPQPSVEVTILSLLQDSEAALLVSEGNQIIWYKYGCVQSKLRSVTQMPFDMH